MVWGGTHPPPTGLSLPIYKTKLLDELVICSFFQKGSPFSGSWCLPQRRLLGGAGRAPGSPVLSPCALAWCPGPPAPGGRTKPSARLGATFRDPRLGVWLGRALALAPRQALCALERSLVGRDVSTPGEIEVVSRVPAECVLAGTHTAETTRVFQP